MTVEVAADHLWTVVVTASAGLDFQNILVWTLEEFGDWQASVYAKTLSTAIIVLSKGPDITGVKKRPEIGKSHCTLYVRRGASKGGHLVLFRVDTDARRIEILRLLHQAMDLNWHVIPD